MDFVHKKIIHSKKMYNGSYCKTRLLNKAFITLNPPVTTLLFSDTLHSTVIPRPKCICNKGTSSTYEWHSTFNILPATEINPSSLHILCFHHDVMMLKRRALSAILYILPPVLAQVISRKMYLIFC